MKRVRLLVSIVAAAALVPLTASAAFAAPPGKDHPDGAVALSLGDTIKENTSQATTDDQDAEANQACGAPFTNASVWFTYSPSADGAFIMDMSKSDYTGGFMVFVGDPSSGTLINCGPTSLGIEGEAGTTYVIMAFSDTQVNGGKLVLSLEEGPPPPDVTVTVSPAGKVFKNGDAELNGTISCKNADFADLEGTLVQIWKRVKITGFFSNFARKHTCDGTPHAWTAAVRSDNGLYAVGKASVKISTLACGPIDCTVTRTKQAVMLQKSDKKPPVGFVQPCHNAKSLHACVAQRFARPAPAWGK
jgi:hypothetical protein